MDFILLWVHRVLRDLIDVSYFGEYIIYLIVDNVVSIFSVVQLMHYIAPDIGLTIVVM